MLTHNQLLIEYDTQGGEFSICIHRLKSGVTLVVALSFLRRANSVVSLHMQDPQYFRFGYGNLDWT